MSELASDHSSAKREAIVEALVHILGNGCRLMRTSMCSQWNVKGAGAKEAATVFNEQAVELFNAQNKIADRIWFLGGLAIPNDNDDVVVLRPQDQPYGSYEAAALVRVMVKGHENAVLSLKAACDVARDIDDIATSTLLADRILAHEDHIGSLRRLSDN